MAFGDVLAGMAEASHEHQKTLLSMEHEDRVARAHMLSQLATNPAFAPEQQIEFAKGAFATISGDKSAKEWEGKAGNIQIPTRVLQQPPTPPAINIPGSEGAPAPISSTGQVGMATAPIAPQTIQPPTPPPQYQTVNRGLWQPMSIEERQLAAQQAGMSEARIAGMKAGEEAKAKAPYQRNVQKFGWGGTGLMDQVTGQIIREPDKKPKRFQSKTGTVNGQPAIADFDPESGKYYHPDTGEELTGFTPKAIESGSPLEKAVEGYKKTHPGTDDYQAYMAVQGNLIGARSIAITNRQDIAAGRQEVKTNYDSLKDAKLRLAAMKDAFDRAQTAKNPGAADMILLSNHIGMTFGSVKGVRTGQALIEEHIKARSLPENLEVAAKGVLSGQRLSPEQRQEFLRAGAERVKELERSYSESRDFWNYTPPGERENKSTKPEKATSAEAPKSPYTYGKYTFKSQQDLDNFKKEIGVK